MASSSAQHEWTVGYYPSPQTPQVPPAQEPVVAKAVSGPSSSTQRKRTAVVEAQGQAAQAQEPGVCKCVQTNQLQAAVEAPDQVSAAGNKRRKKKP